MKTKVLFWFTAMIIAVATVTSCEKEVIINIPEQKPIIIYKQDNIRIEQLETDKQTPDCIYGQLTTNVYKNDSIIYQDVRCKDTLPPEQEICFPYWNYYQSDDEMGCDTLYNYGCNGGLNFKIPLCPKIIHDTTTEIVHDSIPFPVYIPVIERDTVFDTDTVTIIKEVIKTEVDTVVKFIHTYHKFQCENFNTGSSPDYWEKGYCNENSSESEGTNRYFFNSRDTAITGFPAFDRPSNADPISFIYGSEFPYKAEIILEDEAGLWHIIETIDYPGKEGFDKFNHEDYESIFIEPENCGCLINRIIIRVIRIPGFDYLPYYGDIASMNRQFNIDNFCWGWSWEEESLDLCGCDLDCPDYQVCVNGKCE